MQVLGYRGPAEEPGQLPQQRGRSLFLTSGLQVISSVLSAATQPSSARLT